MRKLPKSLARLKQEASALSKSRNIAHTSALEEVAHSYGFANWREVLKADQEYRAVNQPIPAISNNFASDDDFASLAEDITEPERDADLAPDTKILLAKNRAYFASLGIEYSMFEPTATGLNKAILDATRPVRKHFEIEGFHNFNLQGQQDQDKVYKKAYFVFPDQINSTTVSLYRPKTKKGDPRMWFPKLKEFAKPADQIAIVVYEDSLYLFNFSQSDIESLSSTSATSSFISQYLSSKNSIADELLNKLKVIAKNPIKCAIKGDTAIGMAIELALGIPANSSKKPDYKGIELKGGRGKKNRSNLFAQVADWSLSQLKSSNEILNKYGYPRGQDFKLNCTISTKKENSQGLVFHYDEASDYLIEKHKIDGDVAIWPGDLLRERLLEKHAETFWIQATSRMIDGVEHFDLHSVTHTRRPLVSQLLPLIQAGVITMDHLIKRKGNSAAERGPLFKINKRDLLFLFPEPKHYSLKD
ncbi:MULTISPECIES: MvaI/BcnI family restriction endonuclease [unclassified Methylophilus]|uniref:MvaI/BcnI family restriction endonuclease n=1 Tax=unclassified Methylophilus TaxID=2630143 RepID=UPI00036BA423|nr:MULTISPECIES: MvaI/BcnI family restriction endonuclease [unclassified Methylophilus]